MLGVVSAYHPVWVSDTMRWLVVLVATPVLFWAVTTALLGVSRHIYTLAINRQIPSWLGKLNSRHATPQVAIAISGVIAIGLVLPTNVKLLAGLYAFGAMLAITIAQLSILRLRVTQPDRPRPFRVPLDVEWRGAQLPLPALLARGRQRPRLRQRADLPRHRPLGRPRLDDLRPALLRHLPQGLRGDDADQARHRHEKALTKQVPEVAFRNILVPVFGTKLDDDIVATAGRLAAAEQEEAESGEEETRLDLVYVIEVPLTLPLDAELPAEIEEGAQRALKRASDVAEEYADVNVSAEVVRARGVGAGIVEAARRYDSEAIVIGGEPPTKIKGGAKLGGIGAAKPAEIGAATEYVLKKAPCRVLLTAPPEARRPARAAPRSIRVDQSSQPTAV